MNFKDYINLTVQVFPSLEGVMAFASDETTTYSIVQEEILKTDLSRLDDLQRIHLSSLRHATLGRLDNTFRWAK